MSVGFNTNSLHSGHATDKTQELEQFPSINQQPMFLTAQTMLPTYFHWPSLAIFTPV